MKFKLHTDTCELLTDTMTPVNMYLKIRDAYPESVLLESSDYGANGNSVAYICFNPIAAFKVHNQHITERFPDGSTSQKGVTADISVVDKLEAFAARFETDEQQNRFLRNGLFGYTSYEAVLNFEDIELNKKGGEADIQEIYYAMYQNIIDINVFNNQANHFAHCYQSESNRDKDEQLTKEPARA